MLDTPSALGALTLAEIIGPIVLGIALIYGIVRSRRRAGERGYDDEATRRLYADEERSRPD
jgi:hypothetical protein